MTFSRSVAVANHKPYGGVEEASNSKAGQRPTFPMSLPEGVSRDAYEYRDGDRVPCPDCGNSPAGVCAYHVEAARLLLWYAEAALKLGAASGIRAQDADLPLNFRTG